MHLFPCSLLFHIVHFNVFIKKSDKKSHEERKTKKAYIAWDDNDSSEESEKEEINLLTKDYESEEDITQRD